MFLRKLFRMTLIAIVALSIWLVGCSDNSFVSSTSSVSENAPATVYVPLEQGWRINYATVEPSTEYYSVEVTEPISINGNPGYTIRHVNSTTNELWYSYMYSKDNAIYESFSTNQSGEKILEAPFVIGHSWSRIEESNSSDNNDSGYDWGDGGDDPPDEYGEFNKTLGSEYTMMTIVGKETIATLDGTSYGNCLKVEWPTGENSYAHFWYAAGIGLVKYESVSDALSSNTNKILSIITDYQKVEY
ncbi:MAG: hypothetical protein V3V99_09695 [candidate division Zixibacteria bacterium]